MDKKPNIITAIFLGVLVSFYLFPIGFSGLPEALNTKQVMAVIGVLLFAYHSRWNGFYIRKSVIISAIFALIFSVWCYLCVVVNNTTDLAYATYIRSFAIWLSGAYCVVYIMKQAYGDVTISLITKYLLFVCLAQCVFAQMVDNIPAFHSWVDRFIIQDVRPKLVNRLYGIGASLDSAGVRFATTLVFCCHMVVNDSNISKSKRVLSLYLVGFLALSILGAMIARTTLLGTAVGLVYLVYHYGKTQRGNLSVRQVRFWRILFLVIALVSISVVYLYNTNSSFRDYLRFAFEAFFNYSEEGEFYTGSSDVLMNMWRWPTDSDGWIYGYGHFDGWFYNTDIGYCRFTLYCGVVGMALFSLFFIANAWMIRNKFKDGDLLALMLLVIVFVVWVKVSTDIFQFFALLLLISSDFEESEDETESEDEEGEIQTIEP